MAATRWALRAHAGCGTEAVAVSAPAVAAPDDAEAPEIEPEGVAVAAGSAEEDSPPDPPQPARTTRTAHAAATRTSRTPRRTGSRSGPEARARCSRSAQQLSARRSTLTRSTWPPDVTRHSRTSAPCHCVPPPGRAAHRRTSPSRSIPDRGAANQCEQFTNNPATSGAVAPRPRFRSSPLSPRHPAVRGRYGGSAGGAGSR